MYEEEVEKSTETKTCPFVSNELPLLCFVSSNSLCYLAGLLAAFSLTGVLLLAIYRDDLEVPTSPYFPVYARGQGPPPMVLERFQSVISQLLQFVGTMSLPLVSFTNF